VPYVRGADPILWGDPVTTHFSALRRTTALAAAGVLVALAVPASAAHGRLVVTGLTVSERLVTFAANNPGTLLSEVEVTGFAGDLQSIDFRPRNGLLYGLATTEAGGTLYTVDPVSGVATPVLGAPTFPVSGAVSIDVNPAADALRVVDSTGTNLRLRFSDLALLTDGPLNYVAGDRNEGVAPTVGAIAYTNNLTRAGTKLYDLDTALGQLALQDPPNAGGLQSVGTGLPQASRTQFTGFDIYEREPAADGTPRQTWAFVSLVDKGRSTFYEIDLATGQAKFFAAAPADPASGAVIGGRPFVTDIALKPAQGV
jgi:hypothetical protein